MNDSKEKSLWGYFISCITEKYACFEGRANRKEFWGFMLFSCIIMTIEAIFPVLFILCALINVAWIVPYIAVLGRRLNDINFPPELYVLPIIIPPVVLIIGCMPSYKEENVHGPVP